MKKKYFLAFALALMFAFPARPAHALINWGEDELNKQLKGAFNKTDGTGVSIGGLVTTGKVSANNLAAGSAGQLTVNTSGTLTTSSDVQFRTNLVANGRYGNASTVLFSSSTTFKQSGIPYAVIYKAIGNSTENSILLPQGTVGQEVQVYIYACGPAGSSKWLPDAAAASPVGGVKSFNFTSVNFAATPQSAKFMYVSDAIGWNLVSWSGSPTIVSPTATINGLSGNVGG